MLPSDLEARVCTHVVALVRFCDSDLVMLRDAVVHLPHAAYVYCSYGSAPRRDTAVKRDELKCRNAVNSRLGRPRCQFYGVELWIGVFHLSFVVLRKRVEVEQGTETI